MKNRQVLHSQGERSAVGFDVLPRREDKSCGLTKARFKRGAYKGDQDDQNNRNLISLPVHVFYGLLDGRKLGLSLAKAVCIGRLKAGHTHSKSTV